MDNNELTELQQAELLARRSNDLSATLTEIADEMRKGDDADIRWLRDQADVVDITRRIVEMGRTS